jgi:CDP-diglyceride synthetase
MARFYKNRRDVSIFLLAVTACCLLMGRHMWCILLSAGSLLALKEEIFFSANSIEKSIKWMFLSVISFSASLIAFVMMQGQSVVDEDKAYLLKFTLGLLLSLFSWCGASSLASLWCRPLRQRCLYHYIHIKVDDTFIPSSYHHFSRLRRAIQLISLLYAGASPIK